MVPNKVIERVTYKRNLADAAQDICIRRRDGGRSVIGLKSFDRFRESFQGTAQDVIWVDEEPPADGHAKCLLGLMTTNGLVMCSFTPLRGLSDVVLMFMPGGRIPADQIPAPIAAEAQGTVIPANSGRFADQEASVLPPGTTVTVGPARPKGKGPKFNPA